jgi:hypothetical protein
VRRVIEIVVRELFITRNPGLKIFEDGVEDGMGYPAKGRMMLTII